jgi:hypothetical protein
VPFVEGVIHIVEYVVSVGILVKDEGITLVLDRLGCPNIVSKTDSKCLYLLSERAGSGFGATTRVESSFKKKLTSFPILKFNSATNGISTFGIRTLRNRRVEEAAVYFIEVSETHPAPSVNILAESNGRPTCRLERILVCGDSSFVILCSDPSLAVLCGDSSFGVHCNDIRKVKASKKRHL